MDPTKGINISNAGNYLQWIADIGAITTATNTVVVDFPGPIENLKQVWLTGYYLNNLSTHKIKVGIEATGFNMINHLVSFTPVGNAIGTQVPIIEPGTAIAAVRRDLGTPIPLFTGNHNPGSVSRFIFKFSDWTGAPISASEITLMFALILQPAEQDPNSQYQMLPRSRRDISAGSLFHYHGFSS